jgi:hypothetical protein
MWGFRCPRFISSAKVQIFCLSEDVWSFHGVTTELPRNRRCRYLFRVEIFLTIELFIFSEKVVFFGGSSLT